MERSLLLSIVFASSLLSGSAHTQSSTNHTTINVGPNAAAPSWVNSTTFLSGAYRYIPQNIALLGENTWGEMGAGGGSESMSNGSNTCCSIGVIGYEVNDNTISQQTGWASVFTATRQNGAGTTFSSEMEVANLGAEVDFDPFQGPGMTTGATVNVWLGCGGEAADMGLAINPCSNAITMLKAHTSANAIFERGIVVENNALKSWNTSFGPNQLLVLNMPRFGQLTWYNAASKGSGFIRNDVSAGNAQGIVATDFGTQFQNGAGQVLTEIAYASNAANFPVLNSSTAGNGVIYSAAGTDSNIDVHIAPKGNGHIAISGPAAPTMASCGTSPRVAGNDMRGLITVGAGSITSCVMNFAATWRSTPICVVSPNGSTAAILADSATTLEMTVTASAPIGGAKINYYCLE